MKLYSRFCQGLTGTIWWVCLVLVVVIVVSLAAQIFWRYVLNAPLQHTDEFAQVALTAIAFLGSAALYRERGHIEIDFFTDKLPPKVRCVVAAVLEIFVIISLMVIVAQIFQVSERMARVTYGSFPARPSTSKFALLFVPLLVGSIMTILFAVEAFLKNWIDVTRGASKT